MNTIIAYKEDIEGQSIEYEILAPSSDLKTPDVIKDIDARLLENQQLIDAINVDLERWTSHLDKVDNIAAVSSGVIAGLVDSFFVGKFDLRKGTNWGKEKVEAFVKSVAKRKGYKGDSLLDAVTKLEEDFKIPADSATNIFGGGRQHHLRDFSHHPTPLGLLFSLLTQFTGKVFGTNTAGIFIITDVPDRSLIGNDLPTKLTIGTIHWLFHMVSDMAGSSGMIVMGRAGTGLPGPLVSFLKELSALPFFKKTNKDGNKEFSVWVSKLFNGTLLADRDESGKIIKGGELKFDLRGEIGLIHEIGKQSIPILLNEAIVRSFYFFRRLSLELRAVKITSLKDFIRKPNWKAILPYNNRSITRMITISTGTFVTVDLADASIRALIKTGPTPAFFAEMVLCVNFVGIGRFALALSSEWKMEHKRNRSRDQRIRLMSERIMLSQAKVFYKEGDVWAAAENSEMAIDKLTENCKLSLGFFMQCFVNQVSSAERISGYIPGVEKNNPDVMKTLVTVTKY